jgi:hypothetical protein
MKSWKKNPAIYEINTWVWLREMSAMQEPAVTLGNVPGEKWDELKNLNVEAVWLMGVWERSPRGISISNHNAGNLGDFRRALPDFTFADNVGSPYCVRRYAVDPHLGGNSGLAVAREQLALRGIKLILDFVPNHLAHDHPWVTEFPEFFIRGDKNDLAKDPVTFTRIGQEIFACGKDPFYPAWEDVLQVNAFHPGLRAAMTDTVTGIAAQCDGVRCDMAMLMINDIFEQTWGNRAGTKPAHEYWTGLISAIRSAYPDFIFIAESYWDMEWRLQQQGFDFCYDKRLYDRLEQATANDIRLHLSANAAYQSKLIRFIENHDEPRHVVAFQPGKNRAAAVVSSTLPGARLYHEGQFEGRKIKLPVFLCRRPDEPVDFELKAFCGRLLETTAHPAFHYGSWQLCRCAGWPDNLGYEQLLAWCWFAGEDRFLVVVNYSPAAVQGYVQIPDADLKNRNWRLYDVFREYAYSRSGNELLDPGLYVDLGRWSFHLFKFHPE